MTRDEYLQRHHEFHKRGNALPQSKLNPAIVRQIRENDGWTSRQWADHLGVHFRTVEKVRAWETWWHVR